MTKVAPNQAVNNTLVSDLLSNNFILAASSSRFGNQVQTLFTRDYDLSGNTNVYLVFNAIYAQNQDSIGAIEYSIDAGVTWLAALYLLDGPDILRDELGNLDASNTMAFDYSGNATETPPPPGNYGAFIGVDRTQWANLGPFLSPRINDDLTGSKRVEAVRLAQADNAPAVRFRIAQAGDNSWYFGIDQFGLYSLTNIAPPLVTAPPASQTIAVGNSGSFNVGAPIGIGPMTFQWRRDAVNLVGKTNQILPLANVQLADAGNYDVVVTNPGGSVTSSPPALLTVINPIAAITGQWDFDAGNLAATIGRDLEYYDISVQTNTFFGTTTSFGIADIAGQPANVMKFTPTSGNSGGLGLQSGYKRLGAVIKCTMALLRMAAGRTSTNTRSSSMCYIPALPIVPGARSYRRARMFLRAATIVNCMSALLTGSGSPASTMATSCPACGTESRWPSIWLDQVCTRSLKNLSTARIQQS